MSREAAPPGTKSKQALLLAMTLCACGGTTSATTPPDAGDASADAADALLQPDGAACASTDDAFRVCASAPDCTLATVPACGCGSTSNVVGVAKSAAGDYAVCMKAAFDRSLAASGAACGSCVSNSDCVAEDGRTAHCEAGSSPLGVACAAGRCRSFVRSDAGADSA